MTEYKGLSPSHGPGQGISRKDKKIVYYKKATKNLKKYRYSQYFHIKYCN